MQEVETHYQQHTQWPGWQKGPPQTMEVDASNECIFSSSQPEPSNRAWPGTNHSSNHPEPKLINLASSLAKGASNSNDGVAVEASGSTRDCWGHHWRQSQPGHQGTQLRQWVTGMCCWLWPGVSAGDCSSAQTQRRHQSTPSARSSIRRCRPLADLLGRVFGRWLRWCRLANVIRLCGSNCGVVKTEWELLLMRTMAPLR